MFGVIVPPLPDNKEFYTPIKPGQPPHAYTFVTPAPPLLFHAPPLVMPQKRKQIVGMEPVITVTQNPGIAPPESFDASSTTLRILEPSDYDCLQRSITWYDPGCKTGRGEYKMDVISEPRVWEAAVQETDSCRSARPRLRRIMDLKLPLFLTVAYWKRHRYSLGDIALQLEFAAPIQVALVSLMLDVPVSNTAVKPCSAAMDALTYGAKAMIMQRVIKSLADTFPTQQPHPSVLSWRGRLTSMELDDTKIPIPFHSIDAKSYKDVETSLIQAIEKGNQSDCTWFERPVLHFAYVWTWFNEKRFVPLKQSTYKWPLAPAKTAADIQTRQEEKTETYIKMGRVVPYSVYLKQFNERPSIAEMPNIVMIANEPWCVVTEMFFLYADEPR